MTTRSPSLRLRCGRCDLVLATMESAIAPRRDGAQPYPGDDYVLQPIKSGHRPARDRIHVKSTTTKVHHLDCRCGASYKIRGERAAGWWAEFAATGRRFDTRWLGRDR